MNAEWRKLSAYAVVIFILPACRPNGEQTETELASSQEAMTNPPNTSPGIA
jgi:hypothetical protein